MKESIALNRYLAESGVCSRRKAVEEIKSGLVEINGEVVKDPFYKVDPRDKVFYKKNYVYPQQKVYILMNKPEGAVTTVSDEFNRPTVLDLIKDKKIEKKRIFPVGRLDVNTTGLLLLTNDGELAQKLSHPKFGASKTYQVLLDQNLGHEDFVTLKKGVRLHDGFIKPDKIYYPSKTRKKLVVKIHSGKNRIVRRIFKALGYNVTKLERIEYSGLTKRGLPKGMWRILSPKDLEVIKNSFNLNPVHKKVKKIGINHERRKR